MNSKSTLKAMILAIMGVPLSAGMALAQDCAANAGGNAIVCGSTATLTGGVTGTIGAAPATWTFISGPATPTIVSPNSLTTNVTGMTADGNYLFQLSQPCNTGTAQSQVTITAHPRPAGFTAGPDITGICATTGTGNLNGVIPAGFTGSWSAVNIFNSQNFGTIVTTNSSFSNNTIANPVFSLINKANHDIDPAYYAILTIVSNDGICSYRDTAVVRFCPNPALNVSNTTKCIDTISSQFFDFTSGPAFNSETPGSAGAAGNGTTITLNVSSQPAGGNITFNRISGRRIYVTGAGVQGTYTFTITVSNCCGTVTSAPMSLTVTGINSHAVNFQPTGHGAPEQLTVYAGGSTGGELHCGIAGTSNPETFYFSINPADPDSTITTVTSNGILPPGASTPIVTLTGAGTANRMASVNPGASGWKVGTYSFNIQTGTGSCLRSQEYYIHISDNSRLPLFVPDTIACYPGAGSVTATIRLPDVYQGVVNSSYFQDFGGYYNFQVISKPAGSATPTFTASNMRRISQATTTVSNLDKPGDYVIRILPFSGNGAGPFLQQEYACSGISGPLQYDFTIHLNQVINSNAGSDQTGVCANTVSLLGNATGAGTGQWTVASAPVGTTPVITAASSASTTATNMTEIGQYRFVWTITTPTGNCKSSDTVSFDVTCSIPLPVGLTDFTAIRKSGTALLQWATLSETNNKGFGVQRSADGITWDNLFFVGTKGVNGNSNEKLAYNATDKKPLAGINYYRLQQTDRDGKYAYSEIKQVHFDNGKTITLHPNPAKDYVSVDGLEGGEIIKIYDATGRVVKETKTALSSVTIRLDGLSEGLYQVAVISANGDIISRKMMKAK